MQPETTRAGESKQVALKRFGRRALGRLSWLPLPSTSSNDKRTEWRLRAQEAVTHALAESSTLAEASPKIFRAICENLGCDWGELWRVDPEANVLRCTQTWHPGTKPVSEMERVTRAATFSRGEGIAGTVWRQGKPVWITDVLRHPDLQRASAVARYGLRAAFAFPILLNKEVLGVIAVFSREVLPPDKYLLRMLKAICNQIGQVMGRRRAERLLVEASEREQQRIGQDLHDGLCQQLAGLAYLASDLQANLARKSCRNEASRAARIAELARATATQARQVARGLNPVKLGTLGLMAALRELTASVRSIFSISCRFECRRRVLVQDHETAVHLYRIAQEAIHNAITHGKASQIIVSLRREPRRIVLTVRDNGRGFRAGSNAGNNGMGLETMNYRARAIGAQLELSTRPGGGIIVTCTLPTIPVRLP